MQNFLIEMIEHQKKRLLRCAEAIVPHVTSDDIMQPNDFPELENHPVFRYEEGVLEGLQTAEAALRLELALHAAGDKEHAHALTDCE